MERQNLTITEIQIKDRFSIKCHEGKYNTVSSCMMWSYDYKRHKIRDELAIASNYQRAFINNMFGIASKLSLTLDKTEHYKKIHLETSYIEEDIDEGGEDVITKIYISSGGEFNNAKYNKVYRTAILRDMKFTEFVFNKTFEKKSRMIGIIIDPSTYDYTVVEEVYDGNIIEDIHECIDAYNS